VPLVVDGSGVAVCANRTPSAELTMSPRFSLERRNDVCRDKTLDLFVMSRIKLLSEASESNRTGQDPVE